ncbi:MULTISPECIES: TadE/TadG family type IV pilus assembly protein [unclassified Actinomyces]|uniref:TadE/TadG family type IV pilus assembly protein n=1 Tax=unclassified Actinomyces TaxID=2609248 RepID=UPI002017FDEF|nr:MULTISPECIES: TadE/TadG family type IV pilus assembly protein [unclassified Actinomyces]MCL3778028.1 pilus assembly protein [Actinomyces sp. AC-20-1]MCL3789991.1 pilus assembly protein [Actinomyces sp. 187325]MCL3791531.1 pilus assembly protein [Actinomyces sp. 186855]MCL3793816.1 pilus assembly protein [Actinomyces sp. 217892]
MPSERPRRPVAPAGRPRPGAPVARHPEEGSAVVDFVLVGVLVIAVTVAVLQLALGLYVRNVLVDAAGEGARRAALVGGTEAEATARVEALVGAALADGYVEQVSVTRGETGGVGVVTATVSAPLPVLGLLGPAGSLTVSGRAVDEASLAGTGAAP